MLNPIVGHAVVITGIFGFGVWFVRTYDEYKANKQKEYMRQWKFDNK